ncbi:HNH endonuclease [Halostagnicola bangensis]
MSVSTEATTDVATDIEEKIADLEYPWQDIEVLKTLYWEQEMSTRDVSDKLGTSHVTIREWLNRHDLGTRQRGEAIGMARQQEGVTLYTDDKGYKRWIVTDPDKQRSVRVHQLLAISHGAEPEKVFSGGEYHCHHKNHMKCDNTPSNIELVTAEEHAQLHLATSL